MPPAMEAIIKDGVRINGFICPGHVAAITGSKAFNFIAEKYRLGCVITGFEPVDIMQSILMLIHQVNRHNPEVEIQYRRAVSASGNKLAQDFMNEVFEECDVNWRGFGIIPRSGLKLKKEYERFDIEKTIPVNIKYQDDNVLCICGDILRGLRIPADCSLFAKRCVPENPVGACMVSNEGACNTFYKIREDE